MERKKRAGKEDVVSANEAMLAGEENDVAKTDEGAKAEAEFAAGAEAAEKPAPKPRRRRQPKAEPALATLGLSFAAVSASTEEEKAPAENATRAPRREKAPTRIEATATTAELAPTEISSPSGKLEVHALDQASPENLQKDVSIANASIESSMDSMVKQWGMVKDITTTVSSNLEKVTKLLTEQTEDLEALKAPVAKPSHIARWAIGASLVATILSVVSLSLSQTARQEALSKEVAHLSAPAKSNFAFNTVGNRPETNPSRTEFKSVSAPAKLQTKSESPIYGPKWQTNVPFAKSNHPTESPVKPRLQSSPEARGTSVARSLRKAPNYPVAHVSFGTKSTPKKEISHFAKRGKTTFTKADVDSIELALTTPSNHLRRRSVQNNRTSRFAVDKN